MLPLRIAAKYYIPLGRTDGRATIEPQEKCQILLKWRCKQNFFRRVGELDTRFTRNYCILHVISPWLATPIFNNQSWFLVPYFRSIYICFMTQRVSSLTVVHL